MDEPAERIGSDDSRHLDIGEHSGEDLMSLNDHSLSSTLVTCMNILLRFCS